MTALIQEKSRRFEIWKHRPFTLAAGFKAWKGGRAAFNVSGQVVPASSVPNLIAIGVFDETVDATSGALPVSVDLEREVYVERFVNATASDACASTDVGSLAYMVDDQTVGILPQLAGVGRSPAGRILDVSATNGVGIERLPSARGWTNPTSAIPAFVAGASAPATLVSGAVYDVPTTSAASTITLPAASPDGFSVTFCADGTKNSSTVTYADATGAVALTTALTAAKRHLVVCTKSLGKWFANAYVSP